MANHDYLIVASMIAATVAMALWPGRGDRPAPHSDPTILYGTDSLPSETYTRYQTVTCGPRVDGSITNCTTSTTPADDPHRDGIVGKPGDSFEIYRGAGWSSRSAAPAGGSVATCANGGAPCMASTPAPAVVTSSGCYTGGTAYEAWPSRPSGVTTDAQWRSSTASCSLSSTAGQVSVSNGVTQSGTWTVMPSSTAGAWSINTTDTTGTMHVDSSALEKKIDDLTAEVKRLRESPPSRSNTDTHWSIQGGGYQYGAQTTSSAIWSGPFATSSAVLYVTPQYFSGGIYYGPQQGARR